MSEYKKSKRSKEEIAKQFDLPERQSKIATIMKQDGQAYCICRTSDSSRFMIGCDGCEEWYHGDCINISEKEAKHIKHYYCQKCKDEDPTLQTVFRMVPANVPSLTNAPSSIGSSSSTFAVNILPAQHVPGSIPSTSQQTAATTTHQPMGVIATDMEHRKKKRDRPASHSKSKDRCGECLGCLRPSCGECGACMSRRQGRKHRCFKKVCMNASKKKTVGRPKRKRRSPTPEVLINPELEGMRHCCGPACRMNARPQSKYCSDECGLRLAEQRIIQVLPQRIQEWNLSPCIAEEQNRKQLDIIRTKQQSVRATLSELEKRHKELDMLVERAKRCTLDPKALESNDAEDEMSMYCITCGHEIHSKTAIRHMEKCFNKYESQASFGSKFKTRIEGGTSMFCDFFNPVTKVYCKRLRVLCPEHSKDPKILDTDVCGCPLVRDLFILTGQFCLAPKKSCFKHYVWEKIRRAEIDLERVRQWMRMDELVEQERQIRATMASRGGVLSLMLHSTYNHDIMEKLLPKPASAVP